MPMQCFGFGSTESFHLFRWLTTERKRDLDALVSKSFEEAETHPMFKCGWPPCNCAASELAHLLYEEYLPEQFEDDGLFQKFGCALQDGTEDRDSISEQLLVIAASRINYDGVAEALLRYSGKWAPDLERPEIL